METLELILNEQNTLSFEVDISGITNEKIDVNFVIENDGMDLSFKGTLVEGVVEIQFPILSSVLKAKTYAAKMAFVIENTKYFEPLHTNVDFVQPISITTKAKASATKKVVKEDTVEGITISSVKVSKVKPIMERLDDALVNLASAKNVGSLISIYNKEVLLKEDALTDTKDAIDFINDFCQDKYGKTFKDFIADNK